MNQDLKSVDVLIWTVANGYRVNPGGRYNMSGDTLTPKTEEYVFESFDALVAHLREMLPVYPATAAKRR